MEYKEAIAVIESIPETTEAAKVIRKEFDAIRKVAENAVSMLGNIIGECPLSLIGVEPYNCSEKCVVKKDYTECWSSFFETIDRETSLMKLKGLKRNASKNKIPGSRQAH